MKAKILSLALAAATACAPLAAQAKSADMPHPEQTRGVAIGTLVGAIAGGPVGAIIGAAAGGSAGYHQALEGELEAADAAIAERERTLAGQTQALAQAQRDAERAEARFARTLLQLSHGIAIDLPYRTDNAEAEPHLKKQLRQLGKSLAALEGWHVTVTGFADRRGTEAENDALAKARAVGVRDLLVDSGLPAQRVQLRVEGESGARYRADDPEGLFFDRRVELRFDYRQP